MSELKQKITLVTGSTKGIGKAIAAAFVDNKAHVVVHGRSREEVESIQSSIGAFASVVGDPAWCGNSSLSAHL